MMLQNVCQDNSPSKDDSIPMNPVLEKECAIALRQGVETAVKRMKKFPTKFPIKREMPKNTKKRKADDAGFTAWERPPDVTPTGDPKGVKKVDKEVKLRTGFETERDLLTFIIIACNGDFDTIKKTHSVLTWYEEWFFYFEMMYGLTIQTWGVAESEKHGFGIDAQTLRKVFDEKMELVAWPGCLIA